MCQKGSQTVPEELSESCEYDNLWYNSLIVLLTTDYWHQTCEQSHADTAPNSLHLRVSFAGDHFIRGFQDSNVTYGKLDALTRSSHLQCAKCLNCDSNQTKALDPKHAAPAGKARRVWKMTSTYQFRGNIFSDIIPLDNGSHFPL